MKPPKVFPRLLKIQGKQRIEPSVMGKDHSLLPGSTVMRLEEISLYKNQKGSNNLQTWQRWKEGKMIPTKPYKWGRIVWRIVRFLFYQIIEHILSELRFRGEKECIEFRRIIIFVFRLSFSCYKMKFFKSHKFSGEEVLMIQHNQILLTGDDWQRSVT